MLCGGCPGPVPLSLAPLHPEHLTAGHPWPSLNPGQHPEVPEKMGLGPGKAEPPAPSHWGHILCTSRSCALHHCPDSSWWTSSEGGWSECAGRTPTPGHPGG